MQTKYLSQSSLTSNKLPPQFQMSPHSPLKPTHYATPIKKFNQNIFVETPQPFFIPLSITNNSHIIDDQLQPLNQHKLPFPHQTETLPFPHQPQKLDIPDLNQPQKIHIPNLNSNLLTKQYGQLSQISLFANERYHQHTSSSIVKSKVEISLKKERITQFFFYQNFIVCKGLRKVIVYNSLERTLAQVPIKSEQFVLTEFPPYVFNCITGQYLNLYNEEAIDKCLQIQRWNELALKKSKAYQQLSGSNCIEGRQGLPDKVSVGESDEHLKNQIKVVIIKISKLEVQCICKYGQAFYMGGYNRSVLPGGKRSERRQVYLIEDLDPKINNKPKTIIKIPPSTHPVSQIHAQMPFLVVYCKPTFYVFGLKSHELLLTFQKELKLSLLLEGRYAFNVLNGIGISTRNSKPTIFTYDVENSPIFGVEITEHKQEATYLCMEKTGRIFGCLKSALFEYIPTKRITKCVKLYLESDTIVCIESTPNNNLLVLRQTAKLDYLIEVFSIEQASINDY